MGSTIILEPENGQAEFAAAYEKLTGVKLVQIKPAHNQYMERVDLAFASGDLPDIFEAVEKHVTYAVNNALWDATDAWYNSPIIQGADVNAADTIKVNGRLFSIPTTHGNGCITYIRKDWLDKLGLSVPKTFDEFYAMLEAFRDRDPDGDGQKNTIPFISAGVTESHYLREFYQGLDVKADFFVKDGRIVEGMYDEQLKTGVTRLARAYKEGLVDKEVVTNTTSAARDKFYTGKVGVFTYWAGNWNRDLENNLRKNVPAAVVDPMPPLQGTYLIDRPAATSLCIPAANKNPLGMFKYYAEVAFDRGEGQMLFYYGVEGKHWTKTNGTYAKLPDGIDPSKPFFRAIFDPTITLYPWNDPFPAEPRIRDSLALFNSVAHGSSLLPTSDDISGNLVELKTAREEIVSKIVMGLYTVDEGFDLYRRQNDKIVQECLTVMNAKYVP